MAVAERFVVGSSNGQGGVTGNGDSVLVDRLRESIKKRRLPETAIGLALVALGIAGSIWLRGGSSSGVEILVAGNDIARGHVISVEDLSTIKVPDAVAGMFHKQTDASLVIGQSARTDIDSGSPIPLTKESATEPLTVTEVLASVSVRSGSFPPSIGVGATVLVVVVPDPTMTNGATPFVFGSTTQVWAIQDSLEDPSSTVVTLRAPRELLLAIAGAYEIRLALVGELPGVDGQ